MNQKKMSLMLKGITIMIALMGAVFLMVIMPMLAVECKRMYEESAYLFYPALCYVWFIGLLSYAALYEFWKICNEIERDNSFSKENVRSLNKISVIAFIAAAVWFVGLLILIIIRSMSISFLILIAVAIFASVSISVVAAVLSHLVQKAYDLKKESELTI